MQISMELTLPRDARFVGMMRKVAKCILEDLRAPADAVYDIQLVLTEACGNAVRHAVGSSEYSVALAVGDDHCEVEVTDVGPGFDPPEDGADADGELESGRGLLLIRTLVDELEFDRVDAHTRVRLTKRWPNLGLLVPSSDGEAVADADGAGLSGP